MTMDYINYTRLRIAVRDRVVTAVIDNPSLNMLTRELLADLDRFTAEVAQDPEPLVVVFKSAHPDIFITHAEFANLYAIQPPEIPTSADQVSLNAVQIICERLRRMDKVTIAQVEGRTAGGGAAMVMACDMRFGAVGKAVFNTMSVPVGSVPGGGASQYMPRLIGYSRALELILGGLDLDAATAERWGYLNRALPAEEIDTFVTSAASRIAACPADAVRAHQGTRGYGGRPGRGRVAGGKLPLSPPDGQRRIQSQHCGVPGTRRRDPRRGTSDRATAG